MPTRPAPASTFCPQIRFAFTDHPITVWAGAILLRLYVELIGLRATLVPLLVPFANTSNQIPADDLLLAWWYGLALGAERFEHLTRSRRGPLLPRLLSLPGFSFSNSLRRFVTRFASRRTTEVSDALMRMSLGAMRSILLSHTLDPDSSVFCRYGEQDRSFKGHNPAKHGRPSHHPLVARLSERRLLRVRFPVPAKERPQFLQGLRMLSEGLPIAAQLEWELVNAESTPGLVRTSRCVDDQPRSTCSTLTSTAESRIIASCTSLSPSIQGVDRSCLVGVPTV